MLFSLLKNKITYIHMNQSMVAYQEATVHWKANFKNLHAECKSYQKLEIYLEVVSLCFTTDLYQIFIPCMDGAL